MYYSIYKEVRGSTFSLILCYDDQDQVDHSISFHLAIFSAPYFNIRKVQGQKTITEGGKKVKIPVIKTFVLLVDQDYEFRKRRIFGKQEHANTSEILLTAQNRISVIPILELELLRHLLQMCFFCHAEKNTSFKLMCSVEKFQRTVGR